MEGILEADDLVLVARRVVAALSRGLCPTFLSDLPSGLERAFVRLCAGICKEDLRSVENRRTVAFCELYQEFRKLCSKLVVVEVAYVEQFSDLVLQNLRLGEAGANGRFTFFLGTHLE